MIQMVISRISKSCKEDTAKLRDFDNQLSKQLNLKGAKFTKKSKKSLQDRKTKQYFH